MPRLNTNQEVFERLVAVGLLRDANGGTPASSTLATAAAKAATTIDVQTGDGADFTTDMLIRIGSGDKLEENIVASVATDTITLKMPLAYAHASGEAVHQRTRVIVGEPTDDGVTASWEAELTDVEVATSFRPYIRLRTGTTYNIEFAVVNFNLENLAAAAGIPEGDITGTGDATSPHQLLISDDTMLTDENISLWAQGVRVNGTTYEVHGFGIDIDPSQTLQLQKGGQTSIRFAGQAKAIRVISPSLP